MAAGELRIGSGYDREVIDDYGSLVESTTDVFFTIDLEGRILSVNPAGLRLTGYAASDRLHIDDLVPPDCRDIVPMMMRRKLVGRAAATTFTIDIVTKDSRRVPLEVASTLIRDTAGRPIGVQGIARDITERILAAGSLQEREDRLRLLMTQIPAVVWTTDRDLRFTSLTGGALRITGAQPHLLLGLTLQETIEHGGVEEVALAPHLRALEGASSPYETRIADRWYDAFVEPQRDADGVIIGTVGVALDITDRREAEATLHRRFEQEHALAEISHALSEASPELEPVLVAAARRMAELVGNLCVIGLVTETGSIEPVAVHHSDPAVVAAVERVVSSASSLSGWPADVLRSKRPLVIDQLERADLANVTNNDERAALDAFQLGSLLVVPLVVRGETLGLIALSRSADGPYRQDEVRFTSDLAERVGLAVASARLHLVTKRRLEQVQALHSIDRAIASALDLRATLDAVVERSIQAFGADAVAIHLLDDAGSLRMAAGRGFACGRIGSFASREGEGYLLRAAAQRRTQIVEDISAAPDVVRRSLLEEEGIVSVRAVPLIASGVVRGVLEACRRTAGPFPNDAVAFLEALGAQAAVAIRNAELFEDLQASNTELAVAYDRTLEGWSRAQDLRDETTHGHAQRVTELTVRLARELGVDGDALVNMRRGALLHDVGKMAVPDAVLRKPGPLTEDEWVLMRKHPGFARELLEPIPYLRDALDIPFAHHERWDGSGYPNGLAGSEIPVAARIFAVVDVYDALRSDRPYREAWDEQRVGEYLRAQAGVTLDPEPTAAFLSIIAA